MKIFPNYEILKIASPEKMKRKKKSAEKIRKNEKSADKGFNKVFKDTIENNSGIDVV